MRIAGMIQLLIHALVLSQLACCASIEQQDGPKPAQTAVFNLLEPADSRAVTRDRTLHELEYEDEDDEVDGDYYYEDDDEEEEEDYDISGDHMPRVALSSKPKDPSKVLAEERVEGKRRRGKGKKKGRGKKRNPCLKKYKDFCIHGTCQYLANIRKPSCICHEGYSGERCHDIIWLLPSSGLDKGYNRTTALAVVAVVLSSVCLIIIGLLLALRFHKRGAYDVENEEKVKLGAAPHH